MANFDPKDPVRRRTLFFEKRKQGDEVLFFFLPVYQVLYPGFHGKMFEPVDCLNRRAQGDQASDSSALVEKAIHEVKEAHNFSGLVSDEKPPDGVPRTLHSFSWGWMR